MNKRTFIKTASIVTTGSILVPNMACKQPSTSQFSDHFPEEPLTNWAKNLTYSTNRLHYPTSVKEAQQIVKKSSSLRGLGSQHSFNRIADSIHNQVSLKKMNQVLNIDKVAHTVTVEAGVRYGDICQQLEQNGYALHNLASLPHISVAGACTTATHGSGVNNGALHTVVRAIELVKANGDVVTISKDKDGDLFYGAVVGLGGLGLITKVTLDLLPTFQMQQVVYQNMPMSALERNFEKIMSSAYSVSLFTDWRSRNISEVWIKSRVDASSTVSGEQYFGATLATRHLHPIVSHPAEHCTEQMGIEAAWYERLPHFKMGFTPSSGAELQAEFFVPMEYGYQAMTAIEKMQEKISPHLFISEIRTIAADDFWMSPFYKKPCVAIHFTFKPHWDAVQELLPQIEAALDVYHVRPHWGKLFTLAPTVLQSRIDRLEDYKTLLNDFDPQGKFRNQFLDKNLFV